MIHVAERLEARACEGGGPGLNERQSPDLTDDAWLAHGVAHAMKDGVALSDGDAAYVLLHLRKMIPAYRLASKSVVLKLLRGHLVLEGL